MTKVWPNRNAPPTPETDYLCLLSGQNPLSAKLADYVRIHYEYVLDVVRKYLFTIKILITLSISHVHTEIYVLYFFFNYTHFFYRECRNH